MENLVQAIRAMKRNSVRLTIGGKALGKPFAMRQSKRVVHLVGRFLHLFHR